MSQPTPSTNPGPPFLAVIPQNEVITMKTAWQKNQTDMGLIVYEPNTGEIHLGSFDANGGHDLFLHNLNITDATNWRGGSLSAGGLVINNSGLNVGHGFGQGMTPAEWQQVLKACRQASLTTQTS